MCVAEDVAAEPLLGVTSTPHNYEDNAAVASSALYLPAATTGIPGGDGAKNLGRRRGVALGIERDG